MTARLWTQLVANILRDPFREAGDSPHRRLQVVRCDVGKLIEVAVRPLGCRRRAASLIARRPRFLQGAFEALVEPLELLTPPIGYGTRGLLCREPPGLFLRFAACAKVARNLRKADQPAFTIAQRCDDDVRPKPRSILADAPVLVLEASVAGGDVELVTRESRRDCLLRIEHFERFSDDLLARVTFDPLRARVPADDAAGRIEPDQGVVLDALYEQPELLSILGRRGGPGSGCGGNIAAPFILGVTIGHTPRPHGTDIRPCTAFRAVVKSNLTMLT